MATPMRLRYLPLLVLFAVPLLSLAAPAQNPFPPDSGTPEPEATPMALPETPIGEVFQVRDPEMISDYRIDAGRVRLAVNRLVMATTHTASPADAWRSLVKPTDRVGLKVSAAGRELFSTNQAIVNAVVAGLNAAGVPSSQIIVWDRDAEDLRAAGFIEKPGGYRVRAPYPGRGYSKKNVYASMVLGKLIWGDLDFSRRKSFLELNPDEKMNDNLSSSSHFATVLTNDVTKVVNLPMMSAHASCGLAGALYNMTIPNVDNWRRFTTAFGEADPAIAEIFSDPVVSDKVVLNIMDGLKAQFAGGPEAQPNYQVEFGTIYASKDPVALDTVALKRIDQWRSMAKMRAAALDATYLRTAREYGLGNAGGTVAPRTAP